MVSEEYRRVEASSSATLYETSKLAARTTTPTRIMLDEETVQKYRKKLETLSADERKDEFVKEKNQGNECFKRSRYELAIQHYTKCILSEPGSDVAYSNRAQAFLKMNKYTQALEDCNEALRIKPTNVKAKYRRGLALHHKNMFHKALQDFEDVVKNEPNNFIANQYVSKLRELLYSQPRKIMLLSSEPCGQGAAGKSKVIHIPEKDYHLNPKYRHCVQVNEWGLVKQFCSCNNGEPEFIRQHRRQMETQRRKQREAIAVKSNSDSQVTNKLNSNQHDLNTRTVNSNQHEPNSSKPNSNQHETNTSKLNSKRADESVNILAKGFMKSLSKEMTPPEPERITESGSILESTLLLGEQIVQPVTDSGEPIVQPVIESGSAPILESILLSREPIAQPVTESGSAPILESTLLSGEPIVQTKSSIPLIRNMPLLGDETETQAELEQSRNNNHQVKLSDNNVTIERIRQDTGTQQCPVEREQTDNHEDCTKTENQQKQNQVQSNRPTVHQTVQHANCNGIDNVLELGAVQKKTEKEVKNKSILESEKKTNKETVKSCAENVKQSKMKNIFTIIKGPKHLRNDKQGIHVENKPHNVLNEKTLTRSEPLITSNRISLDDETTKKPLEVSQTILTDTANENEQPMRVLTKAQKRQIRRRTFKKHSQDTREGDVEQKDDGNLYNAETNHLEDNPGNKGSTKSKKDTCKTNDSTKSQATTSDTTTDVGAKKRLKRKISTNSNKPKPNETDRGAGDNGINKHAEQVFKKYDEKSYSKFVEQKSKISAIVGNCQENGEPIGKRCSNKKVNKEPIHCQKNAFPRQPINKQSLNKVDKWLKSNHFSETSLNEVDDNNSQAKEKDIAMLTPRKRNNMVNEHHAAGAGDFYH